MIDIKDLRQRPEYYKSSTEAKNGDPALIDLLIQQDEERRALTKQVDDKKAEVNQLSKQIPQLQGAEKEALLQTSRERGEEVKQLEQLLKEKDDAYLATLYKIPNPIHESVTVGSSDEDNVVARVMGEKPAFTFAPKEHWELCEALNLLDMERAAKVSGSRFFYFKNDLVLLQFALIHFTMTTIAKHGFTPMIPPYMVRERAMFGTGYFPDSENGNYVINPGEDDLYMIGTSEVPLVNYHDGEVLDFSNGPLRYVGVSPCFRREAGSYGKDTKGFLRVHQFEKVEMVSFCHPDHAWEEHEKLRSIEEEILTALELPYQVLNICSGDLGGSAAKKYDLEAWLPGQGKYREMTSTSNTTDYQARRLNIRFRDTDGTLKFAHILNGTGTSMRPLIAIIENYQQEDGSIRVPKVLQALVGKEVITRAS